MVASPRILIVSRSHFPALPDWTSGLPKTRWKFFLERELTSTTQRLSEKTPDLLIIDIETADYSILKLIRNIRREAAIPILLFTSIDTEEFLIEAYDVGVDDCILKPINPRLLYAKLKAWMRHSWNMPVGLLEPLGVGEIKLIPTDRAIVFGMTEPIHLSNLEFRLLYYLLGRRNHIMTTEELCQLIWFDRDGGDATALKNVVYRLRKKIEIDPHAPKYLRTVTGIGYEFIIF